MDVRGKQFGWMLCFTDHPHYQSLEIYLAEDGVCLQTALKVSTEGVSLGLYRPEKDSIDYRLVEDFGF